jgi:O-antigen/teichoic acid export membrane protein
MQIAKDHSKIPAYVNNILSIRILLTIFLSIILVLYLIFSEKSLQTKYVILITGLNILVNAIALNWVFQAVEKMHYIAVRQVLSSLLGLVGVIIFVHSQNEIVLAAFILTVSTLIGNIWFIPIYQKLYSKIKLEFAYPFWRELFKESFPLAFASIMIGIYYNLDMVMLGYMKPESDVGIYNAANKIFLLGIIPLQLIFQAFFPMLSRVGLTNTHEFRSTMKSYAKFILGSGIAAGIFLLTFSDRVVMVVFGKNYLASVAPLSILAMNIIMVSINVFLGNPMMAWGKQKQYAIAISVGAVTNIIFNFALIPKYTYLGAAFATLLAEISVSIGLFILFNKFTRGLLTSDNK